MPVVFVKTFKGYEDRTQALDELVNAWVAKHRPDVVRVETVLAHEPNGRAGTGDLIYTLVYRSGAPLPD
jgi:hypothetical protein